MSSNPFRASQIITPDSSVPEARERSNNTIYEDAVTLPSKTTKRVRIEPSTTFIPPHPDTDYARETAQSPIAQAESQSQYAGSPQPVASAGSPSSPAHASIPSIHDSQWSHDMAAPNVSPPNPRAYHEKSQTTLSPNAAPANPFSRTLASLEAGSSRDRTTSERAALGNNRASLDVESFKNLLMTGKPTPRPSAQPPSNTIPPTSFSTTQFESSSSTDTSSVSRQSLFEPPQEVHAESPRTSYEMAESEEDEQMGLVSEVKKGKKKPPPAPKHRHGKLVTPRQPQVVSFDSFSATEPKPAPVTRPRDNSDVNKPLPPTPKAAAPSLHIVTQDATSPPASRKASDPLVPAEVPTPQKRTPPPVPLARRQSQLRTSGVANRSRSNSSLTISSQLSIEPLPSPVPSNNDPMASAKSPPPPPRPRHGARLANLGTSSANSSSTELPQRSTSVRTTASAPGPSSSRRSTIESDVEPSSPAPSLKPTSSASSGRNTQRVVSNESTDSAMPPPPPPPRRRQSNRSSLDQQRPNIIPSSPTESRRTSTENKRTSIDSKRRTSVASESSLRREYTPADENALYSPQEEIENNLDSSAKKLEETRSDSSNILDDMDKFQREIEELRLRYKQTG
ncbi:hypothetical protein IQ07DRAFT_559348 [Pyrenochaeta sp. DS3sAY3a]|nr:hypothetical protein IQ07DRAFT_559348 [Pyrenochaeta sp. DS3sAY3a]